VVGVPSGIGQIKRDLGALIEALGIVGGGGSPNELRSDAGVMVGVGVEETLKRHVDLFNQDVEQIEAVAAASTTANTAFSFTEDHYLLGIQFSTTDIARMEYAMLTAQPQGQSELIMIAHTLLADVLSFTGAPGQTGKSSLATMDGGFTFPLFGKAETDYLLSVRANAIGGVTGRMQIYRVTAPKGVEIAH